MIPFSAPGGKSLEPEPTLDLQLCLWLQGATGPLLAQPSVILPWRFLLGQNHCRECLSHWPCPPSCSDEQSGVQRESGGGCRGGDGYTGPFRYVSIFIVPLCIYNSCCFSATTQIINICFIFLQVKGWIHQSSTECKPTTKITITLTGALSWGKRDSYQEVWLFSS